MTNQEAIDYLLNPLSLPESMDIKDKLKWHEDALNMAIEALEKHEPMETAPEELGITAMSPIITPCGNCGMELTDRMWFFCPWCGQKTKWRGNQHE